MLIALRSFKLFLICFKCIGVAGCNLLRAYVSAGFAAKLFFLLKDETAAKKAKNKSSYYKFFHM